MKNLERDSVECIEVGDLRVSMLVSKYDLLGSCALRVCRRMQGEISTTVFCKSFLKHLYQASIIFVYTLEYNLPVILYDAKSSFFYIKGRI
jgi:hypothetical protein